MAAQQQGQLGGAKLQQPAQPTPQPPNALAAYSSPQPPPSHQQSSSQGTQQQQQQNAQQSNMGPLTQPPLLAQQFRPNPGVHSAAGMSGAPGGGGGSSAGNAYQSIQGQGPLRGTNPSAGTGAPGEAGSSQTPQGGQLLPGQGQIPSQAGPQGQSQPPGAVSGSTVPSAQQQTEQLRNFVNGLSQRSTEDLLRFREAFARQRVAVEANVLRLRQGVSRGLQAPKEMIDNISRERRRFEILSEGLAKEMARRGME